jgi:hypothetical protein
MLDDADNEVALVERAGRKYWTVQSGGRTYEFRRASIWGKEQELVVDGVKVGSVRRTSGWTGAIKADLPGMPLPVQICVVGVQIAIWREQQSAAAASG